MGACGGAWVNGAGARFRCIWWSLAAFDKMVPFLLRGGLGCCMRYGGTVWGTHVRWFFVWILPFQWRSIPEGRMDV